MTCSDNCLIWIKLFVKDYTCALVKLPVDWEFVHTFIDKRLRDVNMIKVKNTKLVI